MKQPQAIRVKGAHQNNLKNLDIDIPLNKLTVITGVSGSGKSSLAFDTVYAEGQRRYVETFSSYARQFLDRMDKPQVERIDGIPPAIAIDQTNPVRTSRSTVGTMTELNDHLKLLFAKAARLYCHSCGKAVCRDSADSVWKTLSKSMADADVSTKSSGLLIAFPVRIPENYARDEIVQNLKRQGYSRIHCERGDELEVIQDRVPLLAKNRSRIIEDIEAAFHHELKTVIAYPLDAARQALAPLRFSADLHCPDCDIHFSDPVPNLFSFNSPIGACETCRGFGRTIGVDFNLVIPDESLTLRQGAIRPFQTASYAECQRDLLRAARRRTIPVNTPWRAMTEQHRQWVLDGDGRWEDDKWYGVRGFFKWLESKAYKMHIRVLLSKYRAYHLCEKCNGARLKPDALRWRIGPGTGRTVHEVMLMPIDELQGFFSRLPLPRSFDEAGDVLLREVRFRIDYLVDVGLGYLTLDRQSRTLSGGEVQRINLTTALGASLVNTLFVLDEPSIGLHTRDIGRLIGILHKLRDAGNTLIVVEHDPEVMRAADRVLDLGPGPGEHGGRIIFFGNQRQLHASRSSLTAQYLRGEKLVSMEVTGCDGDCGTALTIRRAAEHNLKNIDVTVPLHKLVGITGVSGSGKSTLVQDILYRALRRLKARPVESAGMHAGVEGHAHIRDVVLVDQSPIGRTARSNPVSHVGAFDIIRLIYASQPRARERGYTTGTFSFNSGRGRCPTCSGSGFEHVEMQFLSDVYLRCPDCNGRRFRNEVLDISLGGKSIADVLEMTVDDACWFFAHEKKVAKFLAPLQDVGLGYMRLGQPLPTLSGGEAQRLKLAGHLADQKMPANAKDGTLFLFDEPTTGLHFDDIATLLKAFLQLRERGHSLVIIEHNLDVVAACDWLIDLGPEGGDAGGDVVAAGKPGDVAHAASSHTGRALKHYFANRAKRYASHPAQQPEIVQEAAPACGSTNVITIYRAREHNLKNIDISIPRDAFTVITGVSGSGKSTVAFDILFAEGQRRYLESLNAYARQFVQPASRPDVDSISGVPPTVAIEQRTSRGGRKSTVATVTELYHFLRLLFVKLGTQYCPDCKVAVHEQTFESILDSLSKRYRNRNIRLLAPLVIARKGLYNDLAAWALSKGFAELRVDGEMLPTDAWPRLDRYREHSIELPVGEGVVSLARESELASLLQRCLEFGKGRAIVRAKSAGKGRSVRERLFSTKRACPCCERSFDELDPRLFSFNSRHGWCSRCFGTGLEMRGFDEEQTGEEIWWNEWWEGEESACRACNGLRLRPHALAVKFQDRPITDFTALPVNRALKQFSSLKLKGRQQIIALDIRNELISRLSFLKHVGLGYLTLDRAAPTLSGGEAQRIRLAAQLGSNLKGVCYILDEPTIGLHSHDNAMLLETLDTLKRKGNTIVVVEHDEETIRRANHVIDLGPGGGERGGRLIARGNITKLLKDKNSITGRYLKHPLRHPLNGARRISSRSLNGKPVLTVLAAKLHNLRSINVKFPVGALVCVTGISGSGKSTLVRDILHDNLDMLRSRKHKRTAAFSLRGCDSIDGVEHISRVLEVDQRPIGRTPRSCPATYVKIWDRIRKLFAAAPESALRGYTASRFSFNVKQGRCPACEGQGMIKIEMSFLPNVSVVCEVCGGNRFTRETREVLFKGKSAAEVLHMSIDEGVGFFEAHPAIHHTLKLLQDVGLGYLTLGQQSPTLSGGEAQRIKLVTELAKAQRPTRSERQNRKTALQHTLYVLDEPTIGLHMADVEKLILVLHRLVDAGNTVVVVEHNLDIIAEADWIIDLGPHGGEHGGRIVAQGTPEQVARKTKSSVTAEYLKEFLAQRR
ncbi:MAG: excinuclease ABC subunit A [Chitinivibrionales bacterium]|nr:excinuclease ABC subunit A [Chitinivibrionales bacterium]